MRVYYITIFAAMITSILAQMRIKDNTKINDSKSYNKFFIVFTGLILIFVAGFRQGVGGDYWQYSRNYNMYINQTWKSFSLLGEPGIKIISKVSSFIYDHYGTMFLIASIITIGLSIKTISKYSKMFTFSVLLYIFIGAWHGSFNGVRQYIACAIIFAGHRYIIDKKPIKYILVVILASLFHISALGMIAFYFIPNKRLEFKQIVLLTVVTIITMYSYDFLFNIIESIKGINLRQYAYMTREINPLRTAVALAPILLFFTVTLKSKIWYKDNFYINMLFINAILMLSTSSSAYLNRFTIYTNIYSVLAIPKLINNEDKYLRLIFKSVIIIFYALFWYVEVSKIPSLMNFQWIFNK